MRELINPDSLENWKKGKKNKYDKVAAARPYFDNKITCHIQVREGFI